MTEEEFDDEIAAIVYACPGCSSIARHFNSCICDRRMEILRRNYERQQEKSKDADKTL